MFLLPKMIDNTFYPELTKKSEREHTLREEYMELNHNNLFRIVQFLKEVFSRKRERRQKIFCYNF